MILKNLKFNFFIAYITFYYHFVFFGFFFMTFLMNLKRFFWDFFLTNLTLIKFRFNPIVLDKLILRFVIIDQMIFYVFYAYLIITNLTQNFLIFFIILLRYLLLTHFFLFIIRSNINFRFFFTFRILFSTFFFLSYFYSRLFWLVTMFKSTIGLIFTLIN